MERELLQPLRPEIIRMYHRQGYRLVGRHLHSAVKVCYWTKESLRSGRVCYKELWYPPVQSHRCMQMTPYIGCNCHCLHCWRVHSGDRDGLVWREFPLDLKRFDEPADIMEDMIRERKELLSGWKGNVKVDKRRFEEALRPTMMTMSLTGEPTLYPWISELVEEAGKRGMITFLVTNGTMPEALERMSKMPFQLYVSVLAPDKNTYIRLAKPLIKDAWERLNRTIEILPSLTTRRVLRFTVIKGFNTMNVDGYARIVGKSKPDFIEVKAYEWVGQSRERLPREAMPCMEDVEKFASQLADLTGYEIKRKYKPSGAILLA
ncbi:MAG: 4-demethylwyosine synthase TYW1 [Candidatus Bathyarchaeia archaeon]